MAGVNMSNVSKNETANENSLFIEMVKSCVENSQTLPILLIAAEGASKIQTLHQKLPHVAPDELLAQIENMKKYTLITQHLDNPDVYQITELGQGFKDILLDIEKLKEKYR